MALFVGMKNAVGLGAVGSPIVGAHVRCCRHDAALFVVNIACQMTESTLLLERFSVRLISKGSCMKFYLIVLFSGQWRSPEEPMRYALPASHIGRS